ncbi:MAG: hypothetical protein ABI914_02900, partial [Acidobacteriota bacterium]
AESEMHSSLNSVPHRSDLEFHAAWPFVGLPPMVRNEEPARDGSHDGARHGVAREMHAVARRRAPCAALLSAS